MGRRLTTADRERPDLIASVPCADQRLVVDLKDGRTINVTLWRYPRLLHAIPE